MHRVDFLFLLLFAYAGYRGFRKGFISQAAGLLALGLGIWACLNLTDVVSSWLDLSALTGGGKTERLALLGVTFAGTVVLVHFVGGVARRLVRLTLLGWLDRLLGLVFGVLRALLIASVLLTLVEQTGIAGGDWWSEFRSGSLFYEPVRGAARALYPRLRAYGEGVFDAWPDGVDPDALEPGREGD